VFAIILVTGWRSRAWAGNRAGGSFGGRQLPALRLAPFHGPIVGMGLQMVLGTGAAEEEQNWLGVFSHDDSKVDSVRFKQERSATTAITVDLHIAERGTIQYDCAVGLRNDRDTSTKQLTSYIKSGRISIADMQTFVSAEVIDDDGASIVSFRVSDFIPYKMKFVLNNSSNEFSIFAVNIGINGQAFSSSCDIYSCAITDFECDKLVAFAPHTVRAEDNQQSVRWRGPTSVSWSGIGGWYQIPVHLGFMRGCAGDEKVTDCSDYQHSANCESCGTKSDKRRLKQLATHEKQSEPISGLMVFWIQKIQIKRKPKPSRENTT
jgi:hypothetical protein